MSPPIAIAETDLTSFDDALEFLQLSIQRLSTEKQEAIVNQANIFIAALNDAKSNKEQAIENFLRMSKSHIRANQINVTQGITLFAVMVVATTLAGVIGVSIGIASGLWAGPAAFFSAAAAGSAAALTVISIAASLGLLSGFISQRFFNQSTKSLEEDVEKFSQTAVSVACLMISKPWHEILKYGRWAPSPHNMQSWLFKIESKDTVQLMYDPKRLLPGTNPSGSFMYVGFGVLHEMLSIAAAPLDLEVEATYTYPQLDSNLQGPQPLATLKLVPRKNPNPETLTKDLIIERQTSRLPYDGRAIPKEIHEEFAAIAAEFGHKYEYSNVQSEVDWVVRLNADTMFFDMSQKEARDEVSSWMRFSRADAQKRADGLASEAMGTSGPLMWLFANANWLFRLPGIYQLVRHTYEQRMSGTANVGWLSGPFDTPAENEKAGRMMARLWLTMTKHGIYLHPFGSVITNPKAHKLMDEHFKTEPQREHDLWMLMRLGYSEKPYQAFRMPLEKLIVAGGALFKPAQPMEAISEGQDSSLSANI